MSNPPFPPQPTSAAMASPPIAPPTGLPPNRGGLAPGPGPGPGPVPRQQPGGGRPIAPLPDPSGQVNPTVTPVRIEQNAGWEVYAIHGLNSDIKTWEGPGGFNWLNELSAHLTRSGGEAVSTFRVGWSTKPLSTTNFSTSIMSSARPLANTIIGRRGESAALAGKNIGRTPAKVILIGHSMGGILARALVGFMHKEGAPVYQSFLRSIAGVILLASPSQGSSLGNIASPLIEGLAALTGGMASAMNWHHLAALKPSSPELLTITQDFNEYCRWFQSSFSRSLPVHALRETVGIGLPRIRLTVMVVSLQSADIPSSTAALVQGKVANLQGLNHLQVTGYSSMEDPNLRIILSSFLEMQSTDRRLGRPPPPGAGGGHPPITGGPPFSGIPPPPGAPVGRGIPPLGGLSGLPRGGGTPAGRGRGAAVMPAPDQLRGLASGLQQGGPSAAQF
ncbi:uncharacterized protein A1O9_04110 [Exophiala aquamarina CBS 119918]|uniref:GPI inositol-deacylase n=1 Tax=Exophiala aquamarina CBS 119918 TaxID=1182545 RepID=A0A072PHH1_9EURO|nr:uncharacterized protein A1O9_04110 [Exophiala aquamarina CBS 119918]KEF59266.1 hypothetical protein A1O9_04110 [Exophiala aquamarina CBS 119918]